MDPQNHVVLPAVYDEVDFNDEQGPIRICKDGGWGLADKNGRTILDTIYDAVGPCHNNRVGVKRDSLFGYVDCSGKKVIPMVYDMASDFVDAEYCFGEPLAWVAKNKKWGVINTNGEVVIPFEYDDIDPLFAYAVVTKGKEKGLVNFRNEFLVTLGMHDLELIDNDIVRISDDDSTCAVNLQTGEKFEYDFDVDFGFYDGYAVAEDDNGRKNVVDRQFKLQFDDWHDEIVLLEDKQFLICDDERWTFLDRIGGRSVECQSDDEGVYSHDGKTMYIKSMLTYDSTSILARAGVENLFYLAYNKCNDEELDRYQTILDLEKIEFEEGVNTIGTGWEHPDLRLSDKERITDIYLPSTLRKVHPDAFIDSVTSINSIYVPEGMESTMKAILPSYLHSFVKAKPNVVQQVSESAKKVSDTVRQISLVQLLRRPFSVMDSLFPASLKNYDMVSKIKVVITICSFLLSLFGYALSNDAVLPGGITMSNIFLGILLLAVAIELAFPVRNDKKDTLGSPLWRYVKNTLSCFYGIFFCIGMFFLVFFGINNSFGGDNKYYARGNITKVSKKRKNTIMHVTVPELNKTVTKTIPDNHQYMTGNNCIVEYHEGLFGIYVIDKVE